MEWYEIILIILGSIVTIVFAVLEWRSYASKDSALDELDDDVRGVQQRAIVLEMALPVERAHGRAAGASEGAGVGGWR